MTQAKVKELKGAYNKEFSLIYQLCDYILRNSGKPSLINATLETLLRFLNWIPIGYIFQTKMIELLLFKVRTPYYLCRRANCGPSRLSLTKAFLFIVWRNSSSLWRRSRTSRSSASRRSLAFTSAISRTKCLFSFLPASCPS